MRNGLAALAATAALLFGSVAEAHGPSRQKVTQSVTLKATPEEVWTAIGRFGDLSWDPRAVSVEAPAEATIGARRVVTWEGGRTSTEELTRWNPAARTYSYRWVADDIEALPVTNYSGIIAVKDAGGQAKVEWTGAFYRGYPNNDPPVELNDAAAVAAVTAAHRRGLDALVERFGSADDLPR